MAQKKSQIVLMLMLTMCAVSCKKKSNSSTENDGDSGATTTPTENEGELSFLATPPNFIIQKNSVSNEAILTLENIIEGAVFSFDPDSSTCDEYPWSETFAIHPDGSFSGFATQEGTCSLVITVTSGTHTISHQLTVVIEGCSTRTNSFSVQADSDDGFFNGGRYEPSGDVWAGAWERHDQEAWFRVRVDEEIPADATILNATLNLHGTGTEVGFDSGLSVGIYGELSTNAAQMTSGLDAPKAPMARPHTNNKVLWTSPGGGIWQDSDWNQSPDISSVVQEIVDYAKDGLQVGNSMQFFVVADGFNSDVAIGTENYSAGGNNAHLDIEWEQCLVANEAPQLQINAPTQPRFAAGDSIDITWQDHDDKDSATIALYLMAYGDTGACTSGTFIASDLAVSDGSDTYNWVIPSALPAGEYRICSIIDDGNLTTISNGPSVKIGRDCIFTGATDSQWTVASNWDCNGMNYVPTIADNVSVNAGQTVVTADSVNHMVYAIDGGTGGGQLNIGNDSIVSLFTGEIRQDITLGAVTPACTRCNLGAWGHMYILDDATITLTQDARLTVADDKTLYVGDGTTVGHIVATSGGAQANWAEISAYISWSSFWGIVVKGTDSNQSTINFNGMDINRMTWWRPGLQFDGYFSIMGFDNVQLDTDSTYNQDPKFYVTDCNGAVFSDTTWTNLLLPDFAWSGNLVRVDQCTGPAITITGDATLPGYGEQVDDDFNNILTWTNGAATTCTWTGPTSPSKGIWHSAANWACANGRNGWPDQNDEIIAVNAIIQITQDVAVGEFNSGSSNLTLEFASDAILYANKSQVDVSFDLDITSATATNCGECGLYPSGELYITNGATLTMHPGARISMLKKKIFIGNGTSAGTLKTGTIPATPIADWPFIGARASWSSWDGIEVNGLNGGSQATVDLHRLDIYGLEGPDPYITFTDHFTITRFDEIILESNESTDVKYIEINNCANGTFTDTTWDQIDFEDAVDAAGWNVHATSCSGPPALSISSFTGGSNAGYGAAHEIDPNAVVSWP